MDSNKDDRAYAQWVIIILKNVGTKPFKIANLNATSGKLHTDGNKDHEVSASDYNGKVVTGDDQVQINACGRENAPEGTTGSFDLVDPGDSDRVIRHFYWDCPWASKLNTWTVSGSNSKWMVEHYGANIDGGALGTITVDVLGKGT
ncbi:hypothetical protein NLJ89_g2067 [Agrocybe chaxingu]|uniref:Uncharacterized protein n=1 Tax=Agrocybe chaxingu TaxID=84603 RepID=A0A9W8K7H2_9AGAR|nr:hypothetical protein NLJ89_g2067 [Agrocybe chaxingu]